MGEEKEESEAVLGVVSGAAGRSWGSGGAGVCACGEGAGKSGGRLGKRKVLTRGPGVSVRGGALTGGTHWQRG